MKQVNPSVFFQYVVVQGLKSIEQVWSNHTSTLTLSYTKGEIEKARIECNPTGDRYFVSTK